MTDSDYIITGTVRSIKKLQKMCRCLITISHSELVDPQSGEILWADEKR